MIQLFLDFWFIYSIGLLVNWYYAIETIRFPARHLGHNGPTLWQIINYISQNRTMSGLIAQSWLSTKAFHVGHKNLKLKIKFEEKIEWQ